MQNNNTKVYSSQLKTKIDTLIAKREPLLIGPMTFNSPVILAPMSGITSVPFRSLMEELGAGATVSELISVHGINNHNIKTLTMLDKGPKESITGIQLFGENGIDFAKAIPIVEKKGADFIDINMGCPVRKVVTKGAGSALLLLEHDKLKSFFSTVRKACSVPLSIKIRTGWDHKRKNALEVVKIAEGEGIDFVTIHGRTKAQLYSGDVDWELIETIAGKVKIPIIGNGNLTNVQVIGQRMAQTNCKALMLGRAPLHDPFIFLKSLVKNEETAFTQKDYFEVILRFQNLIKEHFKTMASLPKKENPKKSSDHIQLILLKKHIAWLTSGFTNASKFRNQIFASKSIQDLLKITSEYFCR